MSLSPTALSVTSQSSSAVALAWVAPTGPAPTNYVVYRAKVTAAGAWAQPTTLAAPAGLTFTDSSGSAGVSYLYQVSSVTAGVESPVGNGVVGSFITAANTARVPGPELGTIDVFFGPAFAVLANYTAFGFAPVTIKVIFNDEAKDSSGRQGADINNTKPQALCKSSDVPNLNNKALLVIAGITYHVAGSDPDGAGLTTIWLSRDAQ